MDRNRPFGFYIIFGIILIVGVMGSYGYELKEKAPSDDWRQGGYFKIGIINEREIFIDPLGKPFYSKGMIYAYGPDRGPLKHNLTAQRVIDDLILIKGHGFNTLNLYGNRFLEEILSWCEKNKIAVYLRTDYTNLPTLPQELAQFPDFMDPQFREMAKHSFDGLLNITKNYHSVLAIDMDQRWLFDVDYHGRERFGVPKLGPKSIEYLPLWLKRKHKDIETLNRAWNKEYHSFDEVLKDRDVIIGNYIRDLDCMPWRVDFVEYTLWTINDFLKELTGYMRTIDPYHLITYTTDLPEVIPFPISTKENSGIDFISPVHLNSKEDFFRDWIGNGELLYMTKWLNDLYDMPVYISDTGFRTSPLQQNPPNMNYALAERNNETHVAELYLREMSLISIYPWTLGWAYFKLYDKLLEGDFGYIRDDRSLKPVSKLGQYINNRFSINRNKEKEPVVWIYYPAHALASPYPSYQQYKSLVLMLEEDFLSQHEKMVKETLRYVRRPSNKISQNRLLTKLSQTFNGKWLPFAFTSKIPNDDRPVILAGRALEQLTQNDRILLATKRTITIGPIGINDERFNDTKDLYLDLVGIRLNKSVESRIIKDSSVTISMGEIECSGLTPWMILIDREELGDCKVLASFSTGYPAIVQSNDGRHIAFLYDSLTWDGKGKEISRKVSEHAKMLMEILRKEVVQK